MSDRSPSAPLLLVNGTPVAELYYEAPAQPWFRGRIARLSDYSKYSEVLDNLSWNAEDEAHLQRILKARKRAERYKLQIRYENGVTKSLNKTLFHVNEESRFSHRMCAEDFLQIYQAQIRSSLKDDRSISRFVRALYNFAKLRAALLIEEIQRRVYGYGA